MERDCLVAAAFAGALTCALSAQAGMLVPVPLVPNSLETAASSINDNGVLTGDYMDQDFRDHGLVGTLDGNYIFFDYNSRVSTHGISINKDGVIAGWALQRQAPWLEFQFVRSPNGKITTVTLDGKHMKGGGRPGTFTDNGQIVGYYEALKKDGSYSEPKGLLGQGSNYESKIALPFKGMGGIFATGVNNTGDVAGYFESCPRCDGVHGFVVKDGAATEINYPDDRIVSTAIYGINDKDLMVGQALYADDSWVDFSLRPAERQV